MIEARDLTKTFGDRAAIRDVSFSVKTGEIVGFLGPNGAGKTTTMRILTGYFPPTSGSATVAGFDIWSDSLKVRERIGYLPESPPVYREMSVRSYLEFVSRIRGIKAPEIAAHVDEALATCGITDVAHRLIGNLSKGYRQRVGLAQALVHKPEVLILDEPTVGLDPKQIIEIRELIKGLRGRATIVLSTHILPEVEQTCERVIVIHGGRVVATDTLGHLGSSLTKAGRIEILVRRPGATLLPKLRAIEGVKSVEPLPRAGDDQRFLVECDLERDLREEIARAAVDGGFGLVGLRSLSLSLEDVFLKLTVADTAGEAASKAEEGAP